MQNRKKWLKRTSFNVFTPPQKKKKNRSWEKTEKIQPKPNLKGGYLDFSYLTELKTYISLKFI